MTSLGRTTGFDASVRAALSRVHDPCSVAAGRPKSLIEMGLVLGWELDASGHLAVRFCVTMPMCTMAPHFTEAAKDELGKIEGVHGVTCTVDAGFFWTPERMSPDARSRDLERRMGAA